jgi:tetratricopeptide (TPR) repeat protein
LLTGGARTALPRQHTLLATLDWSYDLLARHERAVLNRLAVFAGGFTLDAASLVATDDAISTFEIIDLISQLVARSLVVADTKDARTRYRLLDTTRAYALLKLAAEGETDATRRLHARYFRDQFEEAWDSWEQVPDAVWHTNYVLELDNVRAALDWAFGSRGDPSMGIALAGASGGIWSELFLWSEGRQRLQEATARFGAQTPESDQARLWLRLGILWGAAMPDQAMPAFKRAIDLYRRLGDASGLGISLVRLAIDLTSMTRFDEAAPLLAEALPLLERAGLPKALARCFFGFGFLKMLTGDPSAARMYYRKSLSLNREAGADRDALVALGQLAGVDWELGDLDAALSGLLETIALMRKSPYPAKLGLGQWLSNLASLHTERGELSEALAAAREGLPMLKQLGYAWIGVAHVALRAALAGKVENAARLAGFADSIFAAKKMSRQPHDAHIRDRLQVLLEEKLTPKQLERLSAEGASFGDDEACRLALED